MENNLDNSPRKKRILILDNGGTVSMKKIKGMLEPVDGKDDILNLIYQITRPIELSYVRVNQVDSANLSPQMMKKIFDTIVKHYGDFDGFVILSGTDTLAYLSSFLSFWLIEIHKTVVITGSQKPLNELGSDAPGNIYYSIMFACEDIPEVTVFFGKHIYRGSRVTKADSQGFDAFDSPNFLPIGHVDAINHRIHSPLESLLRPVENEQFEYNYDDRTAVVSIYPGINPQVLEFYIEKGYRGIILEAYGMGNMPAEGELSLVPAVAKAVEAGIVVCVITKCYRGGVEVQYETARPFDDVGAVYLRDMTCEAAYAKLSWLLGKYKDIAEVKKKMLCSISGEMVPMRQEDGWRICH